MIVICRKWNEPETEREVTVDGDEADTAADEYAHRYISMLALDVVFIETTVERTNWRCS